MDPPPYPHLDHAPRGVETRLTILCEQRALLLDRIVPDLSKLLGSMKRINLQN